MSEEPAVGEVVPGSLDGVQAISVMPWESLRWIFIKGQRVLVQPDPEVDLAPFVEMGMEALQDFADVQEHVIPIHVEAILKSAGVAGLMEETSRLRSMLDGAQAAIDRQGAEGLGDTETLRLVLLALMGRGEG